MENTNKKIYCYVEDKELDELCNSIDCSYYAACSAISNGELAFEVVLTEEDKEKARLEEEQQVIDELEQRKKGFQLDFEEDEFTEEGTSEKAAELAESKEAKEAKEVKEEPKIAASKTRIRVRGNRVGK